MQQRKITIVILTSTNQALDTEARINEWVGQHASIVERWQHLLSELRAV